jgi:hypothetical protein
VPGGVARYDEDWNPRAFGDNITSWGTPVVLIENGGIPPGRPFTDLTRLDYVALLVLLDALARDDAAGEDPAVYEGLKRNADGLFVDVLVSGGRVAQPTAPVPYRADVGFDVEASDRESACGARPGRPASRVREVGDGRLLTAARRVDATGRLVLPALAVSVTGAAPWLDGAALDAMARLGVGRVRWHVSASRRGRAEEVAERLAAPGRPAVEIADPGTPACPLRASARPRAAAGPRLADALAAVEGRRGSARAGAPDAGALLRELTCAASTASVAADPLVTPGARASLLVLRPAADAPALDPSALLLESVFVDGRAPADASAR